MAYKAKKKTLTLTQFKFWLEGFLELQPEDWCPNPSQWKLIRTKIDAISVKMEEAAAPVPVKPIQNTVPLRRNPVLTMAPSIPGSIPLDLPVEVGPGISSSLTGGVPGAGPAGASFT